LDVLLLAVALFADFCVAFLASFLSVIANTLLRTAQVVMEGQGCLRVVVGRKLE
jgi:hypothetical protein